MPRRSSEHGSQGQQRQRLHEGSISMALLIGNWMSSHGTSMDVSTGAYFNSGVNQLKRSGRLKRDTRLGLDV